MARCWSRGATAEPVFTSAELYDPATGTWTTTGSLNTARYSHTATLLPNGQGAGRGGLGRAGDPFPARSCTIRPPGRGRHRLAEHRTLLSHGDVAAQWQGAGRGGRCSNGNLLSSAELYDPATGTWTATGSLNTARYWHTATLLPNGKVLVAGGFDGSRLSFQRGAVRSGHRDVDGDRLAEHRTRMLTRRRCCPMARCWSRGADGNSGYLSSAELYDPATGTWTTTGSLNIARVISHGDVAAQWQGAGRGGH